MYVTVSCICMNSCSVFNATAYIAYASTVSWLSYQFLLLLPNNSGHSKQVFTTGSNDNVIVVVHLKKQGSTVSLGIYRLAQEIITGSRLCVFHYNQILAREEECPGRPTKLSGSRVFSQSGFFFPMCLTTSASSVVILS